VGDPRISKISNFDGFDPVRRLNFRQPRSFGLVQYYSPLKSRTITLGDVHLTHQLHSSLGSSIHRALVIKFTSTLLKPAGDPKPDGCGRGCDFSPADVAAGGFGRVPRVWLRTGFCQTRPVAIPTGIASGRWYRSLGCRVGICHHFVGQV
jgi:hypothetical protein